MFRIKLTEVDVYVETDLVLDDSRHHSQALVELAFLRKVSKGGC